MDNFEKLMKRISQAKRISEVDEIFARTEFNKSFAGSGLSMHLKKRTVESEDDGRGRLIAIEKF